MKALWIELRKARRRFDLPVAVLIGGVVLLWASQSGPRTEDALASGYSALFYALPLMNTIIMPISMAVLASRIWDVETKGNGCRFLFTLQSRRNLYTGKLLLGLLEILLVCAVEFAGLLALSSRKGFTEPLDGMRFLWTLSCTFIVNVMLYALALLVSIRYSNPTAVTAAGMVGSLSGIFAAFFPEVVSFLMPWGYYVPLSAVRMLWDSDTRVVWYEPVSCRWWLLCVTVLLTALFLVMGWRTLRDKEV